MALLNAWKSAAASAAAGGGGAAGGSSVPDKATSSPLLYMVAGLDGEALAYHLHIDVCLSHSRVC